MDPFSILLFRFGVVSIPTLQSLVKQSLLKVYAEEGNNWTKVSNKLGMTRSTIQRIASGESANPRLATVERIMNGLASNKFVYGATTTKNTVSFVPTIRNEDSWRGVVPPSDVRGGPTNVNYWIEVEPDDRYKNGIATLFSVEYRPGQDVWQTAAELSIPLDRVVGVQYSWVGNE